MSDQRVAVSMLKFVRPGNWPAAAVSVAWTSNNRRLVPEVEAAIDTAWQAALARPGVHLFDGPMCRLESWNASNDRLRLILSKSTYKAFLGTNMTNPGFADDFGTDVMANPLGVSPALLTADGQLLLGRRNESVAYYPGRVHPFAGCMEPRDEDPFDSIFRELQEELSIAREHVAEINCTGLVEDGDLRQPELIFSVVANLSRSEIEARLDPVEHHSIWSIPATSEAVEKAVLDDKQLTPVALAALLLWGRVQWGKAWMIRVAAAGGM